MEDLAKPSGITLAAHNQHLDEQAKQIIEVRPAAVKKYLEATGQDLVALLTLTISKHDIGKQHPKWQTPCRLDYEEYKRSPDAKVVGRHLLHAKIRHEIASLYLADQNTEELRWEVKAAIAAHHGKLSRAHEDRWRNDVPEFSRYWDAFWELSNKLPNSGQRLAKLVDWRYRFSGPRALLQLADHRASAGESSGVDTLMPLRTFRYDFPFGEQKRGVQKVVEDFKDEWFSILRAPTGSGKTDAALLWASHQISVLKRADRLVIAMPTRFTASALSVAVEKNLSETGIYHSSTFLNHERDEQEMARLLETPATVTTIDHLCICLTGTREDHHAIFFNLANACVVIDEADFYDEFTQSNILVLLRALRQLKVPVLVMSATVPESAIMLYEQSGCVISKIYEDTTPEGIVNATRARCDLHRVGTVEKPQDIERLLSKAVGGEPLIIYANTVKRAQAYYDWFDKQGCADRTILYHSRFTEPHKAAKEKLLLERLGPDAWKSGKTPNTIAVLTQIGEMSVNISADMMISDICPVDRLAQRVGRLCRFAGDDGKYKVGHLYLVDPAQRGKDNELSFYPAPYGEWHKNVGWVERESLTKTRDLLRPKQYSAQNFVDLVNSIYSDLQEPSSRTKVNTRKLEEHMQDNWLILPKATLKEEDTRTEQWQSRDISPQTTLYVDTNFNGFEGGQSQIFDTWRDFRRFEAQHGVECSVSDAQRALKNGWTELIHLYISSYSKDEDTEINAQIVRRDYYDMHRGLWFDREDNE